LTDDLACIF